MISTLHHTFPHSCLYLPPVAGRSLYTNISSYLLLLIAYSGVAMHSLLTHAQSAYLSTAHTQPSCTVYKDVMDTHFQ